MRTICSPGPGRVTRPFPRRRIATADEEAVMALDGTPIRRVGLPVDGRGELPDVVALATRLYAAIERAAGADLDVELHVDPGTDTSSGPLAAVVTSAREAGSGRGIGVRVVS